MRLRITRSLSHSSKSRWGSNSFRWKTLESLLCTWLWLVRAMRSWTKRTIPSTASLSCIPSISAMARAGMELDSNFTLVWADTLKVWEISTWQSSSLGTFSSYAASSIIRMSRRVASTSFWLLYRIGMDRKLWCLAWKVKKDKLPQRKPRRRTLVSWTCLWY